MDMNLFFSNIFLFMFVGLGLTSLTCLILSVYFRHREKIDPKRAKDEYKDSESSKKALLFAGIFGAPVVIIAIFMTILELFKSSN